MTYEEFKGNFIAHIEGTAINEREPHESEDEAPAVDENAKKMAQKSGTAKKSKHLSSEHANDNDSVENDKRSRKSEMNNSKYQSMSHMTKQSESFKYEIPESCMVIMMKKVLIE